MATISNPNITARSFLTVDDVNRIFEDTRESVDLLSYLESSTSVHW